MQPCCWSHQMPQIRQGRISRHEVRLRIAGEEDEHLSMIGGIQFFHLPRREAAVADAYPQRSYLTVGPCRRNCCYALPTPDHEVRPPNKGTHDAGAIYFVCLQYRKRTSLPNRRFSPKMFESNMVRQTVLGTPLRSLLARLPEG